MLQSQCRLCLTLTERRRRRTPSVFHWACWPIESCRGGAPTAAAERHRCWTAAGYHMYVLVCICTFGLRMCSDSTTTYLTVSGWCPEEDAVKEGPALQFLSPPLAAAPVEPWLEGLLLLLGKCFKNALLRRSLRCYVADSA